MSSTPSWTPEKYVNTVREILRRSTQDKAFRQQALTKPDEVLESVSGLPLPSDKRGKVRFLETPGTEGHLLPPFGTKLDDAELSDAELERVAGGGSPWCFATHGCYCFWTH